MTIPKPKINLFLKTQSLNNSLKKKIKIFQELALKFKVIAGGFFLLFLLFGTISLFQSNAPSLPEPSNTSCASDSAGIKEYIAKLNAASPLELCYNEEVEYYINLYLGSRRPQLERIFENSDLYFPIIEGILDKYSLPLELKYVAVVESGLNPLAKSNSGALGLWQFLYNTCQLLDLNVTSYIDERRDVFKSTEAACKYLRYLHTTYGNWNLALAAYNGGPGEVRKAIERSGGNTNYWELRPYLSKQASNYIPAFIAFNYLFDQREALSLKTKKQKYPFARIDTLHLSEPASLSNIANQVNLPLNQLKQLNPIYTSDYIPKLTIPSVLVLPKNKVSAFLKKEKEIYDLTKSIPQKATRNKDHVDNDKHNTYISYTVKEGDFYHKLALRYNCTIENIKEWNMLENYTLYPGQKLKIWID